MEKNIRVDVAGQSEDALQQKCFFWFWNTYSDLRGLLFHVPNGGNRNAREGAKFKQIGVVSGVSDLIFLYRGFTYLIELKNENGKQSYAQKTWQSRVEQEGFTYFVVRSLEEFKAVINAIV